MGTSGDGGEGLCSDGHEFPCCGRNNAFLTQTGLPKAFDKLMMLAMITPSPSPSPSCDAMRSSGSAGWPRCIA
jgi:hypothetical protein